MSTSTEPSDNDNPNPDTTTGADATMALLRGMGVPLADEQDGDPAGASDDGQVDDSHVVDQGGDLEDDEELSPVELEQRAAGDKPPAGQKPPPAPAPKVEEPLKDPKDFYARLSARDQTIQKLKTQLREHEAFDQAMRNGQTVQALHSRYGLTHAEYARRALDLPELPGGKPKAGAAIDLSGLPPEMQKALGPVLSPLVQRLEAAEQQNAQLLQRAQSADQERQQREQDEQRAEQVGIVKNYLGPKAESYPLLDAFGAYDKVYDRVLEHVRQHGEFETDRDAAYILDQLAAEAEQAEQARLVALLEKPHARKFLQERLNSAPAAKNEAKPARQEPRATRGRSNGAAPAVPNSIAQQRASRGRTSGWAGLSHEQQLERTAELAVTREAG